MSSHAYKVPGSLLTARPKFFLYHNNSKSFRELRDGSQAGRVEGDLVYPNDPTVSRRQCRLSVVGTEVYIEDCGGTNPTYVNSVPLLPGKKRRIRLNDVIEFGEQRLVLTQQERHAPSNTEDLSRRRRSVFRAMKRPDGSLTKTFTGMLVDTTLVLISRAKYRQLQIRRALIPMKRPPRVEVAGEATRTVALKRGLPFGTVLAAFFLLLSVAAVAALMLGGWV